MSFLTKWELLAKGFKRVGENVLISDKASIYGASNISIGSNVRIDDFCILSAGEEIKIGSYIHIACYASLIGHSLIELQDFSSIAARCNILSSCDDFSGDFMVNPCVPEKYLNVNHQPVIIRKHAVIGAGTVILPGVSIGEGAAVGAMSFVKHSVPAFEIWAGNPARFIKKRSKDLLKLEKQLKHE